MLALTAQSTLKELPAWDVRLDLTEKGAVLGDILQRDPRLPGVVVTENGQIKGTLSRGQYLRLVGRNLGLEVFHPRPLRLMFEGAAQEDEPLVLRPTTPIQTALSEALQRPRELIYEPLIVGQRDDLESTQLVDFQDLLMADSRISMLRNEQMRQILSTVQEGFLLVDKDHRIAAEYSASVEALFETKQLAACRLPAVLGEFLGDTQAGHARSYLDALFDPNVVEKLVTKINPLAKVVARMPSGAQKHMSFRFQRSVEGKNIRHVLVRIEDISREVLLAEELEQQEQKGHERLQTVFEMMQSHPGELADFLNRFHQHIVDCTQTARNIRQAGVLSEKAHTAIVLHKRDLHGLKGECALLGLHQFERRIHRLESALLAVAEEPSKVHPLLAALDDLSELLTSCRSFFEHRSHLAQSHAPAETQDATTHGAPAADNGSVTPRPASSIPAPDPPQGSLFEQLGHLTSEVARRCEKEARFFSRAQEHDIPQPYRALVRDALVQMVRNSIVHGLESPTARTGAGKPSTGTLQFGLREHAANQTLEFIFQDDGAGLNLEAIQHRAQTLGMPPMASKDIPNLIFHSGFSTATEVSENAGRGVGLDLIAARVQSMGGSIQVHTRPGELCAFQIFLPLLPSNPVRPHPDSGQAIPVGAS